MTRETPDIASSSPDYARRFEGEWGRYLLSVQNRLIGEALPGAEGVTLLDAGGGHGQLLGLYRERGIDATVFGSDEVCFEHLDRRGIRCVAGDFLALPFADRSFEVVLSIRQLPHLEKWRGAIDQFCRVAANSVIVDYPTLSSANFLTPLLFNLKKGVERNTRPYTLFRHREIREAFEKNGFAVRYRRAQFLLPMAAHRLFRAAAPLRGLERLFRAVGLTDLAGSPVILRADRVKRPS